MPRARQFLTGKSTSDEPSRAFACSRKCAFGAITANYPLSQHEQPTPKPQLGTSQSKRITPCRRTPSLSLSSEEYQRTPVAPYSSRHTNDSLQVTSSKMSRRSATPVLSRRFPAPTFPMKSNDLRELIYRSCSRSHAFRVLTEPAIDVGLMARSIAGLAGARTRKTKPIIERTATPISSPRATMLRNA